MSLALATALGACSLLPSFAPAPSPTAVSISAACDELEDEARAAATGSREGAELFATDGSAGAEVLTAAATRFETATAAVYNEKVSGLALDASETMSELSELVAAFVDDPTSVADGALETASVNANAAYDALANVCDWSQSAGAACDGLEGDAIELSEALSEASEVLSGDETGAAAILAAAAVPFAEAAAAVENEEVRELAIELSDNINVFSGLINALAADPAHPDENALTAGSSDLNAAFSELATLCDW